MEGIFSFAVAMIVFYVLQKQNMYSMSKGGLSRKVVRSCAVSVNIETET